ncbi:MAG: 50S ribosomal protein L11 methyltransferase [Acetobacteraceae bacterium]
MLETLRLLVPECAVAAYRAALEPHVLSVAWFDAGSGCCLVEAVRDAGSGQGALEVALALADAASGLTASVGREPTEASGWLQHTRSAFPEQRVGRRFVIRGGHLEAKRMPGKIVLALDAAMAFGSGEHGSTRGCLLALERLAWRRPERLLDLGTGSAVLALAAATIWHRPVLAIDCDPDAVRTARHNVRANGLGPLVRVVPGRGWFVPQIRRVGRFDLVLANILARPLAMMAHRLSRRLAPGGRVVLAGLLARQAPMVLAAHRRCGLVLAERITVEGWTTLVLRAPPSTPKRTP